MSFERLQADIQAFCQEREWQVFHTPKNLAMALSVEASEVLEHFMWLTPEQSQSLSAEQRQAVRDELGDVMICLINLAQQLQIDPLAAAQDKLIKVAQKYPVEKARGLAKKYDEL